MSEIKWRKFEFSIVDAYSGELVEEGVVVLHPDVIAAVDDSFREHLYNLNKPEEIAEHIIFNLMVNRCRLNQLDGFIDLPADYARIEGASYWSVIHHFDEWASHDYGDEYAEVCSVKEVK